jgi:hypothetical protein
VFGARRHPGLARFRGSIPCLHIPLATLHGLRYRSPRMTRGQRGWIHLRCRRLALLHIMPVCPGTPQRQASPAAGSRSNAEAVGSQVPGKGTGYPAPSPQTRTCAMNASGSSVASSLRQWRTKQATPRLAPNFADPVAQCSGVAWRRLVSPASLPEVPPAARAARRCLSGRALTRAAFGWEFPISALSIAERVPRPTIAHVASRPPSNAVRWVFPRTASRSGTTPCGLAPAAVSRRAAV